MRRVECSLATLSKYNPTKSKTILSESFGQRLIAAKKYRKLNRPQYIIAKNYTFSGQNCHLYASYSLTDELILVSVIKYKRIVFIIKYSNHENSINNNNDKNQ